MGFRPTRRMVLAFGGIALASTIPGCFGDSSPSTTGEPAGSTTEPTTSIESTRSPVGSTGTTTSETTGTTIPEVTETTTPAQAETTTEPPTTTAERTTYPSGADRLTVKGVDAPGSTSGPLTVNPPNTVSLVEFFATWCSPCKDQMSKLRDLRSKFSREKVSFISITQENKPDAVREFWKEYDGNWRVGIDETAEVTQEFGIRGYPTTVILLPDGSETTRHLGTGGDYTADIETALETADPT